MLKHGTLREDGYRFRGYSKGVELWLSPAAWEKQKDTSRFYYIMKRYGLTRADYFKLMDNQNKACAICKTVFTDSKSIHVDHCHNKKYVRGLLCTRCNIMIGMALENPTILDNAKLYITSHDV
jgi:hypothetical protein